MSLSRRHSAGRRNPHLLQLSKAQRPIGTNESNQENSTCLCVNSEKESAVEAGGKSEASGKDLIFFPLFFLPRSVTCSNLIGPPENMWKGAKMSNHLSLTLMTGNIGRSQPDSSISFSLSLVSRRPLPPFHSSAFPRSQPQLTCLSVC